jgi:hypothetical protein
MRGKGINYDTGFSPGGQLSREDFDPAIVRRLLWLRRGRGPWRHGLGHHRA